MSKSIDRLLAAAMLLGSATVAIGAVAPGPLPRFDEQPASTILAALEKGEEKAVRQRPTAPIDAGPRSKVRLGEETPPSRAKSRPLFRCWQYGRLIYEGPGGPISVDRNQGLIRLSVGPGVQVYDLKSAMCILEDSGA
jgi:hypothetical protein